MTKRTIGFFISPHGFGHASRAAAVMDALDRIEAFRFQIFTLVPRWFFEDSLAGDFDYHPVLTDVGLVQDSPLHEDMARTIAKLDEFFPFHPAQVDVLAQQVRESECECVVCDIAPLGIAVAHAAGIPSILEENFMWDWIYQGYCSQERALLKHVTYLNNVFSQADFHIQTEPVCVRVDADLVSRPVSRRSKTAAADVREALAVPVQTLAVLITMGGIPEKPAFLDQLAGYRQVYFVIPGATETAQRHDNAILLPHRSHFFHPDLLNACDAVVGKSGYSTVAEAYAAGIPFGYISRAGFRESGPMADFIQKEMSGLELSERDFNSGRWLSHLPDLLALPRIERHEPNGAIQVAQFIAKVARHESPTV